MKTKTSVMAMFLAITLGGCGAGRRTLEAEYPNCDVDLVDDSGGIEVYEIRCDDEAFIKRLHTS